MQSTTESGDLLSPVLLDKAKVLQTYASTLSSKQIAACMKVSSGLAVKTVATISAWSSDPNKQSLAIDTFKGDIYSGLQAHDLSNVEREYANKHLVILSGLYGIIRPFDGIMPYRLEMMYKFPKKPFDNLYNFWGSSIAEQLPEVGLIINVSSVEYSRLVTPFVDAARIVTPLFYTVSPKTGEPTFVTVHAKIARGAFARWAITSQAGTEQEMKNFDLLGYKYSPELSKVKQPAFVTKDFGGLGLSIRLLNKAS